MKKYVTKFHLY